MLAILAEGGCIVGAPMAEADVIVVNTCGFLSAARDEAIEAIRHAVAQKRRGRARRVVVAGCLPVRDGESLYEQVAGVDAVVGVNDRDEILSAVLAQERFTRLSRCDGTIASDAGRFRLTPHHTAFLRIAEGCSQRCTYCTVPAIRGPFRSKPLDAVLAEARELVADGAVELNVIAQDTTAYGRDLPGRENLASLLRELDRLEGIEWLRLMYAYPRRFTNDLIDALATCASIVPYVDLPLQHICDPILKRMGRGVTRKGIEGLLARLRGRVAGIAIRTTFIVGFPGESDRQFEQLLRFVEEFRFDALGVFEFSPEEGTRAAGMPDRVPDRVKAERRRRIMLAQQEIAFAANEALAGKRLIVLVDGIDGRGRCVGRYYGQAPEVDSICILTGRYPPGTFVDGRVAGRDGYDLIVAGPG